MTRHALMTRADANRLAPNYLFDRMFNDFVNTVRYASEHGSAQTAWLPPADVFETDEGATFLLDLPGLEKQDVSLSVEGGVLSIAGERPRAADGRRSLRSERPHGHFVRSFHLPESLDTTQITARFSNGVLRIDIARKAEARRTQIEIG